MFDSRWIAKVLLIYRGSVIERETEDDSLHSMACYGVFFPSFYFLKGDVL